MDTPRVLQGDHSLLTDERKREWFQRLSFEERYHLLESHIEVISAIRPELLRRHAPDPSRSVLIVRRTRG